MRLRASLIAWMGALFLLIAATGQSRGVESSEVIAKIEALNRAAIASFRAKEYEVARSQLIDALVLGKSSELDKHPVMARTYLHLGVVYLEGLKEKGKALHNFELALRIRPSIEITPALASDNVILEFEDARVSATAPAPVPAEATPPEATPPDTKTADTRPAEASTETTSAPKKLSAKEKAKERAMEKAREKEEKAREKEREKEDRKAAAIASAQAQKERENEREIEGEKEKEKEILRKNLSAATEAATKEREAREHLEQQKAQNDDELAKWQDKVAKEREAKDQLQKEKLALDKQLAEARNQLQQAKGALDKRVAGLDQSDKKERQTRDQVQQAKLALEKQLAEAKDLARREREAREQLQKEKAATEKQLAAARDSEAKERETKEKLLTQAAETRTKQEAEKQTAVARDKERYDRQEKVRLARQNLLDGPDLPAEIPSKIYCPALASNQEGLDIYVRCATHPFLKARTAILYYRTVMAARYNSLAMERSKKGWFTAVMPGVHVTGKAMQYYIEAMDDSSRIVAREGTGASPNVMALRPPSAEMLAGTAFAADGTVTPGGKARPPRGRSARKRSKTR
jgi:hypothetical protein